MPESGAVDPICCWRNRGLAAHEHYDEPIALAFRFSTRKEATAGIEAAFDFRDLVSPRKKYDSA